MATTAATAVATLANFALRSATGVYSAVIKAFFKSIEVGVRVWLTSFFIAASHVPVLAKIGRFLLRFSPIRNIVASEIARFANKTSVVTVEGLATEPIAPPPRALAPPP
eukprot:Opistho-1_new@106929